MHRPGAPGDGGRNETRAAKGETRAGMVRCSAERREIRALGRVLNRVADLVRAQVAAMTSRARGDPHRVEVAEEHVSRCLHRLAKIALALDRVLFERGNDEGRRRLVGGALRLNMRRGLLESRRAVVSLVWAGAYAREAVRYRRRRHA